MKKITILLMLVMVVIPDLAQHPTGNHAYRIADRIVKQQVALGLDEDCHQDIVWDIRDMEELDNRLRGCQYTYDNLSRLTAAAYGEGSSLSTNKGRYSETFQYDKMGNVEAVTRYGLQDNNAYDTLNLPSKVVHTTYGDIDYTYDASGRKLRTYNIYVRTRLGHGGGTSVPVRYETKYDYCGNVIYRNGNLSQILIEGGYVTMNGTTPQYHYYLTDHLGNNRVVFSEGNAIEQEELDRLHGLDWYDYGARQMDGMRFTTIDPLAEKYYGISPYAYVLDNPVLYIDPDGKGSLQYLKAGYKLGRRVVRNGISALGQTETYMSAFSEVRDAVNTFTDSNASNGEKAMAVLSVFSEFLPVSIGDVKDARKVVNKVVKIVHGNSKASTKAQHAYDIINTKKEKVVKTGVSGGRIRKDGKSSRAESQVRKWNENEGEGTYRSEITHIEPAGSGSRERILKYEKDRAKFLHEQGELDPEKHQKP